MISARYLTVKDIIYLLFYSIILTYNIAKFIYLEKVFVESAGGLDAALHPSMPATQLLILGGEARTYHTVLGVLHHLAVQGRGGATVSDH